MRLRKVPGALEKIKSSPYVIDEPLKFNGSYNELFKNNNPIRLEIGSGKGQFLIKMALKYPNINFIGLEKSSSVLVRAIEKVGTLKLSNLYFINEGASNIASLFYKEIDLIYLNFSDPWPKKRHAKRRLTNLSFLKKYDNVFKDKSIIFFKTDNQIFFENSLVCFNDYNYLIKEISLDLHNNNFVSIMTEYEERFVNMDKRIYWVVVQRL